MLSSSAHRIDSILNGEVLPTFVNWFDYHNTMRLKFEELTRLKHGDNRKGFLKCAAEIAALSIHLLETHPE